VFVCDSFVKNGESIIETQRLFRCRFNIGRHGKIPSSQYHLEVGHIFFEKEELKELKGAIRKQIGTINQQLLERVEENFRERLEICILQNGRHLIEIIFHTYIA
jgi:hypothetical protein